MQGWFSALLLQSTVSHDPFKIILICLFAAQETFLTIFNIEKIFFWILQFKKQHLFKTDFFCLYNVKVYTATLDQF